MIHVASLLFLSLLPCATSRLFSARSKYTGEVIVLLDVQFTIDLAVRQGDQEIDSRLVRETDVDRFKLYEIKKDLIFLELIFTGNGGQDAGFLKYRFSGISSFSCESPIYYIKFFDLKPGYMFSNSSQTVKKIEFEDPAIYPKNIGFEDMSFLSDRNETVVFKPISPEQDGYNYSVIIETTHVQVQAFGVKHGTFGPSRVNARQRGTPPRSDSTDAAIVGEVVGGILSIVVVVAVFLLIHWRFSRRRYSNVGLPQYGAT